jgi:hypothetical protein
VHESKGSISGPGVKSIYLARGRGLWKWSTLTPFSTFLALYGLQNALARVCTKAGNRQSPAPRNNRSTPTGNYCRLSLGKTKGDYINWKLKTVFSFARKIRIVRWCAYSLRCAYHDFQFHDFPCCD